MMTKRPPPRRRKRTTDPAAGLELITAPIFWLAERINRLITRRRKS
jgi:hypothetical protein